MQSKSKSGVSVSAEIERGAVSFSPISVSNHYCVECVGADGQVKWVEEFDNLVTDEGLDDLLTQYAKGSAYTASHFVGLTDGTPTPDAGDTMASHGWTEVTAYSEGTREALVLGTVASQSVDNSASKASYSINGNATAGGAFITTDGTKGGSTGTLYSIGAFAADQVLTSGSTLNVTVTMTTAAG